MTAFDNVFASTPLTAANLQRVIDDMASPSGFGFAVSIVPDTLIVPPGLVEDFLHAARFVVQTLTLKLARPILTGRYEQRRRRRVEGVWVTRQRRRHVVERDLVVAIETVEMLESLCPNLVNSTN